MVLRYPFDGFSNGKPLTSNRNSERIPRRLRRGIRANPEKTAFLAAEDSLQLAPGNLQ